MMMFADSLQLLDEDSLYEHVFDLFVSRGGHSSQSVLGLGYVSRENSVQLTVAGVDLEIKQSLALFNSAKESSSTGAVVWKVSPLFADWLLDPKSVFSGMVGSSKIIVELGTGVAGIVAALIGPRVKQYIATDQDHILKLLSYNIAANARVSSTSGKRSNGPSAVRVCEYDWEYLETIGNFKADIVDIGPEGVIFACDTIYNDYLISHFVNALIAVSRTMGHGAHIILAQQLRSHEILESALSHLITAGFTVWSVPDHLLSNELKNGFAVHYLIYNNVNID